MKKTAYLFTALATLLMAGTALAVDETAETIKELIDRAPYEGKWTMAMKRGTAEATFTMKGTKPTAEMTRFTGAGLYSGGPLSGFAVNGKTVSFNAGTWASFTLTLDKDGTLSGLGNNQYGNVRLTLNPTKPRKGAAKNGGE